MKYKFILNTLVYILCTHYVLLLVMPVVSSNSELTTHHLHISKIPAALTAAKIGRVKTGRVSGFFGHVKPGALKNITLELRYHPFVIHSNPVYFGISKKSENLSILKRLSEALTGLKERGEFERIEKKYQ